MRQVEIAGSYYELGLKYGRIVAESKLNWWWKQPTESALALVKECEREIAVRAPGLLEEIRGIADACESEYDLVLANMTVSYWELSACNVIAVSGNQCRRRGRRLDPRRHAGSHQLKPIGRDAAPGPRSRRGRVGLSTQSAHYGLVRRPQRPD
jgi:hypothetical protein